VKRLSVNFIAMKDGHLTKRNVSAERIKNVNLHPAHLSLILMLSFAYADIMTTILIQPRLAISIAVPLKPISMKTFANADMIIMRKSATSITVPLIPGSMSQFAAAKITIPLVIKNAIMTKSLLRNSANAFQLTPNLLIAISIAALLGLIWMLNTVNAEIMTTILTHLVGSHLAPLAPISMLRIANAEMILREIVTSRLAPLALISMLSIANAEMILKKSAISIAALLAPISMLNSVNAEITTTILTHLARTCTLTVPLEPGLMSQFVGAEMMISNLISILVAISITAPLALISLLRFANVRITTTTLTMRKSVKSLSVPQDPTWMKKFADAEMTTTSVTKSAPKVLF
jgi:hypothetical protein